jgi:hypothetical protein
LTSWHAVCQPATTTAPDLIPHILRDRTHLRVFPNCTWAEYLTAQFRVIESNLEMAAGYGSQ